MSPEDPTQASSPKTSHERARLDATFMQAPFAIAILRGPDFEVELANPALLRLWGLPVTANVIGRSVFAFRPDEALAARLRLLRANGEPIVGRDMPVVIHGPNGAPETRYVDFLYERLRDDEESDAIIAMGTDVTDRVHSRERARIEANARLEVSEERLRRVVEASGVAIWETDGGREILVDARFCALFGLRMATAHMLEDVFAHVAPEDRAHVTRSFRNAKAGPPGTVFVAHLRVVDDHGVPLRYVEWRGGVDADAEGKSRFAGTVIDVSARREVELERERFHADATRVRQRLQMQFAQAPVAVSIVSGSDSVFEMANHLYLEMTGRHDDAVGRAFKDVFAELPPDAPVLAMLEEVKRSGMPFEVEECLVPLDRKGNGQPEEVYFKLTCQPIRDDDGKVVDIMTVAVDVTSQVQARRRIEGLLHELKVADQRKDEFLATLAHELRNPMAAISSALSLLEEVGGHHEVAEKYRETARRQMGTLVRLVDDLLDVARITRGKVELRKEPLDFAAVVEHAVAATRDFVEGRDQSLTVTRAPGAFRMTADATRLEQVVVNLLTNASKYTERGGAITVDLARDNRTKAVFRVKDNGRGIPVDMLASVFDLFSQVAPTIDRKTGGLGLGLTLVKRLVAMHGGAVAAKSEGPGTGSEFIVTLPVEASDEAVQSRRPTSPSVVAAKKRVLVVDDAEDVREMLESFLQHLGHEVHSAADGEEGVARILELAPDVAFVDVGLPVIDGFEVARRVRAANPKKRPILIALTGYGGAEVKKKAKEAGFDLHLTKPVDVNVLRDALAMSGPAS